MKSNFIYTCT